MLQRLFPKKKPMMLGRWGNNLNDTQKSINSVWTNSDHCGDIICGDPKHLKSLLDGTQKMAYNENINNTKVNVTA